MNQGNSDPPEVVGRRSARLSMIIPVTIQGMDTAGQTFRENTWTIGVNKQGAKIATFHPVSPGSQITIVNPVLGRTARGRVIWVGEKRFPEDPFEVGVELIDPLNVWGIKFPPEDWQKPSSPVPGARPAEPTARTVAVPGLAIPIPAEPPKTAEGHAAGTEPPPPTAESEPGAERFNQLNLAMEALSRFAKQQGESPPPTPESFDEGMSKLTRQIESEAPGVLQEATARLQEP